MINAGTCFCHICGKTSDIAYYHSGTFGTGLVLTHNPLKGYSVRPYSPKGEPIKDITMTLSGETKFSEIPGKLTVDVSSPTVNDTLTFKRACPKCKTLTEFFPDQGLLPTYIIAVVGKKATGKSSFMHSLSTLGSESMSRADYPYTIVPSTLLSDEAKMNPTPANTIGKSTMMKIVEKATGKEIAAILLVDTAGELFEEDNPTLNNYPDTRRILQNADAFIFIDPSVKGEDDVIPVYNCLNENDMLEGKVVAYVMNRLDEYINSIPVVDSLWADDKVPLITEHTFPVCTADDSYNIKKLIPRLVLEDMIVNKVRRLPRRIRRANKCSGFIVKSCHPVLADGKMISRFDTPINVYDPIIWILNQLNIFPIDCGGKQ